MVVDVRDDDFAGGNIKGAVNVPSHTFYDAVDNLVRETKDVKTLVFHCALSQVRGPKAARVYAESRQNMLQEEEPDRPDVFILKDGFTQFQVKYKVCSTSFAECKNELKWLKDDSELIEGWDKDVWAAEWS